MDELLESLRQVGPIDSKGRFTMDLARSLEKLRSYQRPERLVLQLISAAYRNGATRIELRCSILQFSAWWDGQPLTADELSRLLQVVPGDPLWSLKLSLLGFLSLRPRSLQVHSPLARLEMRGERLEVLPGPGLALGNRVQLDLPVWARLTWIPGQLRELWRVLPLCPIPVKLNGQDYGFVVDPGPCEILLFLQGEQPLPRVLVTGRQPTRLNQERPWSAVLAIGRGLTATGDGLTVVVNGIAFPKASPLPADLARILVYAPHLKVDLSFQTVVEDEVYLSLVADLDRELSWVFAAYMKDRVPYNLTERESRLLSDWFGRRELAPDWFRATLAWLGVSVRMASTQSEPGIRYRLTERFHSPTFFAHLRSATVRLNDLGGEVPAELWSEGAVEEILTSAVRWMTRINRATLLSPECARQRSGALDLAAWCRASGYSQAHSLLLEEAAWLHAAEGELEHAESYLEMAANSSKLGRRRAALLAMALGRATQVDPRDDSLLSALVGLALGDLDLAESSARLAQLSDHSLCLNDLQVRLRVLQGDRDEAQRLNRLTIKADPRPAEHPDQVARAQLEKWLKSSRQARRKVPGTLAHPAFADEFWVLPMATSPANQFLADLSEGRYEEALERARSRWGAFHPFYRLATTYAADWHFSRSDWRLGVAALVRGWLPLLWGPPGEE